MSKCEINATQEDIIKEIRKKGLIDNSYLKSVQLVERVFGIKSFNASEVFLDMIRGYAGFEVLKTVLPYIQDKALEKNLSEYFIEE